MVTSKFVLALMLISEPKSPHRKDFDVIAESIATAVNEVVVAGKPLFKDDDGRKTASVMVTLAHWESHFQIDARGDCDETDPTTGMCKPGSTPHSFGLYQAHETTFGLLGVTSRDDFLKDPLAQSRGAMKVAQMSFAYCKAGPFTSWLNFYATGVQSCPEPRRHEGAHRMQYAHWIFAEWEAKAETTP